MFRGLIEIPGKVRGIQGWYVMLLETSLRNKVYAQEYSSPKHFILDLPSPFDCCIRGTGEKSFFKLFLCIYLCLQLEWKLEICPKFGSENVLVLTNVSR